MNPILVMVTACVSDAMSREHGVKQVWPCVVRTSAPGGVDSKRTGWIGGVEGVDDSQLGIDGVIQSGIAEQPASATLATTAVAATTSPTRDISLSVPNG